MASVDEIKQDPSNEAQILKSSRHGEVEELSKQSFYESFEELFSPDFDADKSSEELFSQAFGYGLLKQTQIGIFQKQLRELQNKFSESQISYLKDAIQKTLIPPSIREKTIHDHAIKSVSVPREADELRLQIELLKSRVSEERRNVARETQRYDQLLQEFHTLQEHNKQLLAYRKDASIANNETLKLLTSREEGRLWMFESYEGVVEHIYGDEAVVVFEIDDDIVEHTYKRSQFSDQKLPSEGDRLIVYVHVADAPTDRSGMAEEDLMMDTEDEQPEYERKKITGDYEF